jgi:hypothetical protein
MSEGKIRLGTGVPAKIAGASPDTGDQLSYRVSMEVEFEDRTKSWVGMEYSSFVRAGETAETASDRLVGFVHGQLKDRIKQLNAEIQHFTD